MTSQRLYDFHVLPLSEEDGGGYVARVLDLPGCMGDGDSPAEAIRDAEKAIIEWIDEYEKIGREVPEPGTAFEAARCRRDKEIQTLTDLRDRLREQEKNFEGLEDRVSLIEQDIQFLIEMSEDTSDWDRFEIIMKTTGRRQKELFC